MIIISRIIPSVWSALGSLDPLNPNQSQSNEDPVQGVTFLSQLVYSVILHN